MEVDNNNNNNNINIYINIIQDIKRKYDLLRVLVFELLNYYSSVENYYIQYSRFKEYIKKKYSILYYISQNNIKIYTINRKKNRKKLNLPPNTILVIGIHNYYKYKSMKYIIKEIVNYDKKILNYLTYLQKRIITFINGMNNFHHFYTYSLEIYFDFKNIDDFNNSSILVNTFTGLKQNYLSKSTKFMNI